MYKKLALMGLLAVAGCKTSSAGTDAPLANNAKVYNIYEGAPDWVQQGSGAFSGDRGKGFYGVGSASKIMNPSLRRNAADSAARAEIAKIMNTYVANLFKQYNESASNGDPNTGPQEVQMVTNTLKTFTQAQLQGVQIVRHWISNDGSTEFALAQLDFSQFKDDMNQVKALNDRAREVIKARADLGFDELAKEEAKRAGGQ